MDSLFSFSTSNLMMELCGRAPPERMTSQLLLLRRLRRTSISLSLAQQKTYIHANPPKPERNNTIHAIKTHPKVSNTYRPNQTYTRDFGCCLPIYTWYTAHLALPFSLSLTSGDNISPPGGGIFHHPKTNIQLVRLRELLILHDWAHLWAGMIKKKKKSRLSFSSHFEKNYSTICWEREKGRSHHLRVGATTTLTTTS